MKELVWLKAAEKKQTFFKNGFLSDCSGQGGKPIKERRGVGQPISELV